MKMISISFKSEHFIEEVTNHGLNKNDNGWHICASLSSSDGGFSISFAHFAYSSSTTAAAAAKQFPFFAFN